MKPHFKPLVTALALAVLGGCMPALAAVPLRWNVETSRAQPAAFDAYHGETLELCADMFNYGKPLALSGNAQLFYQTNNMAGWWTAPATITSNRIEATLSPDSYPASATALNCFIGGPASSYRAAFRLRILGSPGSAPNTVSPPVVTLDYDAITVQNPPYWTRDEADARYGGSSLTESVVAGWGFTKTVLPSVWPWASISGRPDMTQYLTATAASATYASQSALTTGLAGKLDANGGTATALSIGSMSLGQYGDLFEYRLNFDDTSYSTYLAMPRCAWSLGLVLPTYETQDEPEWTWEERRVLASRPWTSATCASKSDLSALSARVESDHRDSMYTMTSATAYTARTNSVQYIDLTGLGSLTISPPPAVQGRVRDWLVYVFSEADKTDALTFGDFASLLAADASATNRTLKAGVTMFAFSEIASGRFVVGRQELTDVTPAP